MTTRNSTKRRLQIILVCILAILITSWLEFFLHRRQYLIGGGINRVFLFLLINLHIVAIIVFLYLIIRQSIKLFVELYEKSPGSLFKRNLLFAFTIFSVIPSFFVFFVAGKLITTNMSNWFNARISTGLKNSLILHEQQTCKLREDLKICAHEILQNFDENLIRSLLEDGTDGFVNVRNILNSIYQSQNYTLYLWKDDGQDLFGHIKDEIKIWRSFRIFNDRSMKSLKENFLSILNRLDTNEKIFDFYGSLYFSKKFLQIQDDKTYLQKNIYFIVVYRYPENIRYPLIEIQNSIDDYQQLRSIYDSIYWNYLFTFILVTLLILFLSIWCAFYLAKGISRPIQELLRATQRVRKGVFNIKIDYETSSDLKNLVMGFNEMTTALGYAHNQLEARNQEMFMILQNIKEAVFFINKYGRIITYNSASKDLVYKYLDLERFKNKKVAFFGPLVKETFLRLIRKMVKEDKKNLTEEVTFTFKSEPKVLLIHLTYINNYFAKQTDLSKKFENGLLVLIEDLTDIVKISKIKTWQQAARQMAHEIKNPLTPIQLATQRLQRKFSTNLRQDKVFLDCTDTILNQVKIIKDLVTHFAEFAKMPSNNLEMCNLNSLIKEVACLYQVSYPEIDFIYDLQDKIPSIKADKKAIKRVIINLLDNSVRVLKNGSQDLAINKENKKNIKFITKVILEGRKLEFLISDNGPGIPDQVKDKLFLPYVSSEKKNMGLGLAIVHETVSQIGGSIKLLPTKTGAIFQILLPL